jgi:Protein of unknown function (DUF4239)
MQSLLLMLLFVGAMAAAAFTGMAVRKRLPQHHTEDSSRDAVLRSVGLVVTLTAVVLGFLVSSAKAYFGAVEDQITEIAADVAMLDRLLVRFGAEAEPARKLLRQTVGLAVSVVWRGHQSSLSESGGGSGLLASERLADAVEALPDGDPRQARLREQALGQLADMQHSSFMLSRIAQARPQVPMLAVVVSWLVIIFFGFGLVSPPTGTARASMILAAVAAAGALFLILELYSPVSGLLQIPPSILEDALPGLR